MPGHAGRGEVGDVVATPLDLDLEVAGPPADAPRELGGDPPGEVLEAVMAGIPGREDGRAEMLDVAVDVPDDRADVVGGDDPTPAARDGPQDQDDAETGQLVVREQDRRAAERLEDLVERVGVDRGRQPVADRGRPDRDPGLGAPRVGRQVIGQLGDQQHGRLRPDRRSGGMTGGPTACAAGTRMGPWTTSVADGRTRRQPSSDACGSQSNVSVAPASSTAWVPAGRKSSRALSSVDLPVPWAGRGDHQRDPRLDEEPEGRRQLRVERAGTDQLDDGSRFGRDRAEGPPAPRRRGVGHERLRTKGGDAGSGGPAYGRVGRASNGPTPDLRRHRTGRLSRAVHRGASHTLTATMPPLNGHPDPLGRLGLRAAWFCEQCGTNREQLGDEYLAPIRECPSCHQAVCPNCWNVVASSCLRCVPFSLPIVEVPAPEPAIAARRGRGDRRARAGGRQDRPHPATAGEGGPDRAGSRDRGAGHGPRATGHARPSDRSAGSHAGRRRGLGHADRARPHGEARRQGRGRVRGAAAPEVRVAGSVGRVAIAGRARPRSSVPGRRAASRQRRQRRVPGRGPRRGRPFAAGSAVVGRRASRASRWSSSPCSASPV